METSAQRRVRIVSALEDLVAQEGAAVTNRDFTALRDLQQRTAPLVDLLISSQGEKADDPEIDPRIGQLITRRNGNSASLATEIDRTRAELDQIQATRRQLARIAPIYGHSIPAGSQCQVVG